jgi:hypothetical protein
MTAFSGAAHELHTVIARVQSPHNERARSASVARDFHVALAPLTSSRSRAPPGSLDPLQTKTKSPHSAAMRER